MKTLNKIILFGLMLTAYSLMPEAVYAQVTYDSIPSYTAKTTISSTDLFLLATKVSNKFSWRKFTGISFWTWWNANYDTSETALLNASNSWNGINNFDGATFNVGAHGGVNFLDSINLQGTAYFSVLMRRTSSSYIGTVALPIYSLSTRFLNIVGETGADSVTISIDADGALSIPNLTITETITIDSSATFDVIAFTPHSDTVPNVTDTILTLVATNRYSLIMLDLPGDITPGISRIYVQGAQKGMILRIYNDDNIGYITFKDLVSGDDNLYMSGNFSLSKYDFIEFQCVVESIIGQTWMQTNEQNN